ncbi:MAG: hypothetical protein WAO08_25845 [Hyphomicrobiaceae bacterium]
MADPRWLEILKASGWQTTFAALGCAIFLLLAERGVIPAQSLPSVIPIMWCAFLLSSALALASIAQSAARAFPVDLWVRRWFLRRKAKREVADYIPFMSDKERQIIGYLLKYRRKTFDSADDGGYAAPLIARGIVVVAGVGGQRIDLERVPMAVPDHVWEVLEKHADEFPHRPDMNGKTEMQPWRVPWMVR